MYARRPRRVPRRRISPTRHPATPPALPAPWLPPLVLSTDPVRRTPLALALALACHLEQGPPPAPDRAGPHGPVPSDLPDRTDAAAAPAPDPAPAPAPDPTPDLDPTAPPPDPLPPTYLHFAGACDPSDAPVVTVAAVGDVLLHHELQLQAFAHRDRHRVLWSGVEDLLRRPDLTYANLEGPTAPGLDRHGNEVPDPGLVFDRVVYTAYPRFNFHPSVAEDLVLSGFDVVSTANNHALDRHALGVDRTIAALRAARLAYTGTRAQGEPDAPWHTITVARGLRVAWLACTDLLNVRPDVHAQVLRCKDRAVEATLRALRRDPTIHAIILTPHWGKEYEPEPRPAQRDLARRWADAGADAILGAHPHVLQPWEKLLAADGREVLVHYSLGNFASHQPELPRRTTVLLHLALRRAPDGRARLVGAAYIPLHVRRDGDQFFVEAIDRAHGPPDARAHVLDLYGPHNLLPPDAPLRLAPHCDPTWRP